MCHLWVYRLSKSHHLGPVQLQTLPWDPSSGHEILCPPPPPFQHRWDCSLILSQPAPGMPGKVNTSSPSGNPWGRVWLLTLNPLWSGRLLSRNRRHLGNTHRERCALPDTYLYKKIISGKGEEKSTDLFTKNVQNSIFQFFTYYLRDVFTLDDLTTINNDQYQWLKDHFNRNSPTTRLQKQLFALLSVQQLEQVLLQHFALFASQTWMERCVIIATFIMVIYYSALNILCLISLLISCIYCSPLGKCEFLINVIYSIRCAGDPSNARVILWSAIEVNEVINYSFQTFLIYSFTVYLKPFDPK